MTRRILFLVSLLFALSGSAAMAQDTSTVGTAENPDLGTILVDADGMTLYLFLNDEPGSGESTCYDKCAENWPPFSAEEPLALPEGVPGELTLIERTDGSSQVAYNGWPLYYFAKDTAAGDTTGQDVGEVWYAVTPSEAGTTPAAGMEEEEAGATPAASPVAGTATVGTAESADLGTYLVDADGMTLYLFTKDEMGSGESTCYDQCAENWPPFSAEEPLSLPEGVPGELTLIERTDGSSQVAYNGMPLYYFAKDTAAGDTTGQGVGDVWYVVNPAEPGAATPAS